MPSWTTIAFFVGVVLPLSYIASTLSRIEEWAQKIHTQLDINLEAIRDLNQNQANDLSEMARVAEHIDRDRRA